MKPQDKGSGGPRRGKKNQFTTKSGATFKIHRSLTDKLKARKDAQSRKKAAYLATLPKNRFKRILYRLHPKRQFKFWFSREGGIMALKLLGVGIVAGFLLMVGIFAYFRKDLPNLKDISGNNIGGSIRYYDRTGQTLLWEDYDAVKRIPMQDSEISPYIKDATVAIEDKDFFHHGGFDVRGILRAGVSNLTGSSTKQGGSTITQQLVRLTQDNVGTQQTYARKLKEVILSIELERSYSKKEILTGYLNATPYGGIEYGVEAAARDYFQKSAKDLTLEESAFLAAIPKSPRYYSPYSSDFDKPSLVGRQIYILDQMVLQGMITKDQANKAKEIDVVATVKPRQAKYDGIKAPWFVLTAKEQLEDRFAGVEKSGWKITTTLDLNLQKIAEEEVAKGMKQIQRQGGDTAAFVSEDVKTGQVVALVGGSDFTNKEFGQNNYARLRLPPGSSFKPYDYVSLIENSTNVGAGSVLFDKQGPLDGYPCTNKSSPKNGGNCLHDYDLRYPGPVTLRYALGGSRNVPAVKAMLIAGVDKTIDTADNLMNPLRPSGNSNGYKCYEDDNLTIETQCYASSAIGDGAYLKLDEHVHGYATLSRNGKNIPQTYIMKIEYPNGKSAMQWAPEKGQQVVRPEAAYIISDMLSDPRASYFSQKIHNYKNHKFSLKTGTTNDAKDGWLMGYSTQYAAGMWVGYHSRGKVMTGAMETMTTPVWNGYMKRVHDGLKIEEREKPSGLQSLPAYVVRSHVGFGSQEPSPTNDLFPSWYKQPSKTGNKRTLDIISNKLATECTPSLAKKDESNADANLFSADKFVTGTNTDEKDDIHKCSDTKPGITLTNPPGNNCSSSCQFTAVITAGTHALGGNGDKGGGKVNFIIDGQTVQSFDIDGRSTYTLSYSPTSSGSKEVKAQVIDSVLYDASTNGTSVNFTTAGGGTTGGITITNPTTGQSVGGTVNATWTGSGPFSVQLDGTTYPSCVATSNSCSITIPGAVGSNHSITVLNTSTNATVVFKK